MCSMVSAQKKKKKMLKRDRDSLWSLHISRKLAVLCASYENSFLLVAIRVCYGAAGLALGLVFRVCVVRNTYGLNTDYRLLPGHASHRQVFSVQRQSCLPEPFSPFLLLSFPAQKTRGASCSFPVAHQACIMHHDNWMAVAPFDGTGRTLGLFLN